MPTEVANGRADWLSSPDGHYRFDDPWLLAASTPRTGAGTPDPTLFALGNGHVGLRGSVLGEVDSHTNVAIVNGFYESWTISYPEVAYGFATAGQTLLTAPSPTEIVVSIDGEIYHWSAGSTSVYSRSLHMGEVMYRESVIWQPASGGHFRISTERFVSLASDSLVGVRIEVEALDRAAEISVSFLTGDGRQADVGGDPNDPRRSRNLAPDSVREVVAEPTRRGWASCIETAASNMKLAIVSSFECPDIACKSTRNGTTTQTSAARKVEPGQPLVVDRLTCYVLGGQPTQPAELIAAGSAELNSTDYEGARSAHAHVAARAWSRCDIEVDTTTAEQQAIRFAVLQLIQAGARTKAGISAKGVSSNGYEGHYFWDTEAFLLPFWQHVDTDQARRLLQFRHSQLPVARDWAAHLKHEGAFFAWRTINGHEASAYFPAGTAQIHINADVALAVSRFLADHPADAFLLDGVEILVETARFFAGYGFIGNDEHFHLHCVTGPDEYTALIDDNYYTNRMVQANLRSAVDLLGRLSEDQRNEIVARTGLEPGEPLVWADDADCMYLGYDDALGIRPQDNSFLSKKKWNFSDGGPKRPLLLDQHPTTIYRHQVLKQSDVVLADFVFEADGDLELVRRNFDYYEALTTGDSSLSAGIQATVAARLGYADLAIRHFQHALWTDLDNLHGNAADGIHVATAGSIWLCIVRGFVGLTSDSELRLNPNLPTAWGSVSFTYLWSGQPLRVSVSQSDITVENQGDASIDMVIRGHHVTIEAGSQALSSAT